MKKQHFCNFLFLCGFLLVFSCEQSGGDNNTMAAKGSIERSDFGTLADGRKVHLYTLKNANDLKIKVTNYGGIITELWVPDREGKMADVVLGCDSLADYLAGTPYFGAIIGRYGNRIDKGRFQLAGKTYILATNNSPNHLHGGEKGFDKVLWEAEPFQTANAIGLIFRYLSKNGEKGYPGNLQCKVTYTLDNDNRLTFDYEATTDQPTVCNLTQHSYFNLAGHDQGDVNGHFLSIHASHFTPVDAGLISSGELRPVDGTPFDFRKSTTIGARLKVGNRQLAYGAGYDHNWVLDKKGNESAELAASAWHPASGRYMEVWTTEPGIQFYGGNFLDGSLRGKGGHAYQQRSGFCLETQRFPDSPNKAHFPSVVLKPGDIYQTSTSYRFSIK